MSNTTNCPACHGEGYTADDDDRTPWSAWASLPWPSNMAVVLGLVSKIPCEQCNKTDATPCADCGRMDGGCDRTQEPTP